MSAEPKDACYIERDGPVWRFFWKHGQFERPVEGYEAPEEAAAEPEPVSTEPIPPPKAKVKRRRRRRMSAPEVGTR